MSNKGLPGPADLARWRRALHSVCAESVLPVLPKLECMLECIEEWRGPLLLLGRPVAEPREDSADGGRGWRDVGEWGLRTRRALGMLSSFGSSGMHRAGERLLALATYEAKDTRLPT